MLLDALEHAAETTADPAPALALALRQAIAGEVRFGDRSRALYSTDASNYRHVPIGVVVPRTIDDVLATVALCHQYEVPVLPRGGGTSLAGQTCNVAVVLDFSKYLHHVLEVDPDRWTARVQPGTVLDDLRAATEPHGLTFAPDPATHNRCTIGGMIGNDSCGVHSIMSGRTSRNVIALDVLTYDGTRLTVGALTEQEWAARSALSGRRGEIYAGLREVRDEYADLVRQRFPDIPRRVSGYSLDALLPEADGQVAQSLVGSEGTCAIVLEATLRLVPNPPERALLLLGYPDIATAADAVMDVMAPALRPIGLEGLDQGVLSLARARGLRLPGMALFPDAAAWLLVEYGADSPAGAAAQAESAAAKLGPGAMALARIDDRAAQQAVWEVREAGLGVTAIEPDGTRCWSGWEDAGLPPARLGAYLRDFRRLTDQYGYSGHLFGHFGDGCVHTHLNFDFRTEAGIRRFRRFLDDAADLTVAHGGSLSGEHGDGQARGALLERMFGPELVQAFHQFHNVWDPEDGLNPGILVHARPPDTDLRLGPAYDPRPVPTVFHYPEDDGDFRRTVTRCVGVGKCRRTGGGTMCPSFMATREEAYSTRGRARLLFEMLQGEVLTGGWRDEAVKDALDLCLACKACKAECPVGVDMATYKAEFLNRFYEDARRPRAAYALAYIGRWARLSAAIPGGARLANLVTQTPGLDAMAKWLAGVHPDRQLPRFAPEPFTRRFRRHAAPAGDRPRVLLFADTVNNHIHPETSEAAVAVLEAAGFRVEVPGRPVCCGRPYYDFGLLEPARRALEDVLDALAEPIAAGVPVVGLEPSCLAVFRDELPRLFPGRADAARLAGQSYWLAEFLARHAPEYRPAARSGRALVHGHCHQKALGSMDEELALLRAAGYEVESPDAGCCGMAGAFGFRKEHYEVSVRLGERVLLPAVREAEDAVIVADGFSCREQVRQGTGRQALHLAEVLAGGGAARLGASRPSPHDRPA